MCAKGTKILGSIWDKVHVEYPLLSWTVSFGGKLSYLNWTMVNHQRLKFENIMENQSSLINGQVCLSDRMKVVKLPKRKLTLED